MTRPRKDRAAHEARGERAKEIRDALELSQSEFLPLLNEAAALLGLPTVYAKDYVVSRTETGARPMSFEDVAVWSSLDKEGRGWEWLALGDDIPVISKALFKKITGEVLRMAR